MENPFVVGARRICVSVSDGDKVYLKKNGLSPSRMLQEKISELREGRGAQEILALRKEIQDNNRLRVDQSNKIARMASILTKQSRAFEDKLGTEEYTKIIDKIY